MTTHFIKSTILAQEFKNEEVANLALNARLSSSHAFRDVNSLSTALLLKVGSPDQASASPGTLPVMQILKTKLRPTKSEIPQVGPSLCILTSFQGTQTQVLLS